MTQETSFFRYPAVYDAFEKRILPEVQERKVLAEPAHAAHLERRMFHGRRALLDRDTMCDALKFAESWKIEILATDVSRRALNHAERGIYKGRASGSVAEKQLATHFTETKDGYQVKPRIQKMISFTQMNLARAVYVGSMD